MKLQRESNALRKTVSLIMVYNDDAIAFTLEINDDCQIDGCCDDQDDSNRWHTIDVQYNNNQMRLRNIAQNAKVIVRLNIDSFIFLTKLELYSPKDRRRAFNTICKLYIQYMNICYYKYNLNMRSKTTELHMRSKLINKFYDNLVDLDACSFIPATVIQHLGYTLKKHVFPNLKTISVEDASIPLADAMFNPTTKKENLVWNVTGSLYAFLSGTHSRLGESSAVSMLCEDVLEKIVMCVLNDE